MNKTFFLAFGLFVVCWVSEGESRTLTKRDIKFDIHKMKNGPQPTLLRMTDEMCILIGSLYKRRELDEVNQRSLIRIRGYLAHVYHRGDISDRQKKRIYMAIRQITAELENRVAFEKRYAAGLVATSPPLPTSQLRSAETNEENPKISAPSSNRFRKAVRGVIAAQRIQRARPEGSQMGSAYGVRESRGRRLYNLIQAGLLTEASLEAEDLSILNAYRQSPNFQKDQEAASRPRGGTVPIRRNNPALPARGLSPLAPSSMTPMERGRQPLRTDNILRSVEQQIDQRIQSGQLDPNRRDPQDYRDQIQGASDEEWAAS